MISEILIPFELNLTYLRRLVADLSEEQMVTQPHGLPNHPTWILGHLVFSFQAMAGELGVAPWLPESWSSMFGAGTIPKSSLRAYPSKHQLHELLEDAQLRLTVAISNAPAAELSGPLPDEAYRAKLPTVGHALVHLLVGHASLHVGQLTVWRSAMRLPYVPEPFDRTMDQVTVQAGAEG